MVAFPLMIQPWGEAEGEASADLARSKLSGRCVSQFTGEGSLVLCTSPTEKAKSFLGEMEKEESGG